MTWMIIRDCAIGALVGASVAVMLAVALTTSFRPHRRSVIERPDRYGLPSQGGSATLIQMACEESLERSRARRGG